MAAPLVKQAALSRDGKGGASGIHSPAPDIAADGEWRPGDDEEAEVWNGIGGTIVLIAPESKTNFNLCPPGILVLHFGSLLF